MELGWTFALPINTGSLAVAVPRAGTDRAVGSCEPLTAHADAVDTLATRLATILATSRNGAVDSSGTIGTIALSIVAIAVVSALVGAAQKRAVNPHVGRLTYALAIHALTMPRAVVVADLE